MPAQIRPVVERCLAKDPAARPTPAELLAELGGGQLAVDWLPEPIAAALGRYAPEAEEPAVRWRGSRGRTRPCGGGRRGTGHGREQDANRARRDVSPGEPASTRPSGTR